MTTPLAPCPACHRHLRIDASICPFCSAPVPRIAEPRAERIATHVSRAAIIAMGALATVGCSSPSSSDGSIAQPYGAPPMPARLNWTLSASQSSIKMADRAAFRLTISVTNAGSFSNDPQRGDVSFKVNGQASPAADLAFSNGTLTPDWQQLPPGATATDARDIGTTLFEAPGKYVIELLIHGESVSQVSVDVAAD
jgi:hypothetical protein